MKLKDKVLFKVYSTVEETKRESERPSMLLTMLIVNMVVPVLLSSLGWADALQPLLEKTRTEWEGSGVVLATLVGVIIGTVIGMFNKGWSPLVFALIGGFIGGGAAGISSCTTSSGKSVNWTP